MSTPLRVLDTGLKPARWNIAMSAALAQLHCAGAISDTLRFHRYPRSVLLGSNGDLQREVRVERCQSKKIEIARRIDGGGTAYMSPGRLAWDLIIERRQYAPRLGEAEFVGVTIAAGLARLGLPARFKPPNEIIIDGRKISGFTAAFDGSSLLVRGTVLIEFDPYETSGVLKAPSGAGKKYEKPMASVSEFFGRVPPVEEIEAVLIPQLADGLRRAPTAGILGADETTLAERLLAEKIGIDAFVSGNDRECGRIAPIRKEKPP